MSVEVLKLHEIEGLRRAFDAVVDGVEYTSGLVEFEPDAFEQPRTYIYVDRFDPLGDSYAMKHGGSVEELNDDATIVGIITRGLIGLPIRSKGPVSYWDNKGEHILNNPNYPNQN